MSTRSIISERSDWPSITFKFLPQQGHSLAPLTHFRSVDYLNASGNNVTSLEPLAGHKWLKTLFVNGNAIGSVSPLAKLRRLENLWGEENRLTSLNGLEDVRSLRKLQVNQNQITDLSALRKLTDLRELSVLSNRVASLEPLSKLVRLHTLCAYDNAFSDLSPLASCGTNLCTAGACPVLFPAGTCPQKYRCETGACVPDGLLLYWNLDETSPTATIANDSSGHGYHGTFTGAAGFPVASMDVAPGLQFFNPSSRAFTMGDRHAIQLAPMPPAIKRVNDITVSAFYRGTVPDSVGQSAVISLGDSLGLHVGQQEISLFKHVAGPEFVNLFVVGSPTLDGRWHHVAGVVGTGGMRLFFDGQEQGSNLDGRPIIFIRGTDLWVGRHGSGRLDVDFGGNIDDVRIFDRALSNQEIADLSRGLHAP